MKQNIFSKPTKITNESVRELRNQIMKRNIPTGQPRQYDYEKKELNKVLIRIMHLAKGTAYPGMPMKFPFEISEYEHKENKKWVSRFHQTSVSTLKAYKNIRSIIIDGGMACKIIIKKENERDSRKIILRIEGVK